MTNTNSVADMFKAYDIRGVYPDPLNKEIAYKVAQAYAKIISDEVKSDNISIVVSQDMRLSSKELSQAIINGLRDHGVNVVDIGMCSTPILYFAVGYLKLDGGIQVSASHNPAEYNGFKMVRAKAVPVSGDSGIYTIRDLVLSGYAYQASAKGHITNKPNMTQTAVDTITKDIPLHSIKPFKIVVDAANAMGALDMKALFDKLPCTLIPINFDLDGTFPSHEADPLKPENLKQLQDAVIKHQADLGLAPDGDGDRYFVIDNIGKEVRQEILRGIMAQISLNEYPGRTVCYDVRPGKITIDMINEAGGKASPTKVGHSLIKEQMIKENAVFGGESSGHYFYQTQFGTFEVPFMLIPKFLIWLTIQDKPLAQAVKPYQRYFHSGEINSVVEDKEAVFTKLKSSFTDANIIELDGVTIEYPDFWFNVRGSNTEPKIRLNLEAVDQKTMEQKRDLVLSLIRE